MEEDFQILFEYKKAQEANTNCLHSDCVERDGVYECTVCGVLFEKEPEPICMHSDDEVLQEGSYVCTGCGLVLTSEFRAEVNWADRCIIARSYTPIDRLQAVDKHLITFFEKTGVNSPLHPIQEKLRYIKKECKYKSLNYAISLLCILEHDVDSQEKLYPFLPKSDDYDPEQTTTDLQYLDANNLYGWAMCQPLPISHFTWEEPTDVLQDKILTHPNEDDKTGYIIECDLDVPSHLHDLFADYPLAPEKLSINPTMLSPYQQRLVEKLKIIAICL